MTPRAWASAWTPATPTRPASTSPTRSTGSRRSPAGSTWCTATTRGMSSARAGTGTPTSPPGPSTPPCCSAWSAPQAPRLSARPPTTTTAWPPMSAGLSSTCPLRPPQQGRQPKPELILGVVEDAAGRIIVATSTHPISFGIKNVPHHIGGEQAYGEQPGEEGGEVPPRADAGVAGYLVALASEDEDEITPDAEEVGHLGELPEQVGPQPGTGEHRQRHQPDDVLR